MNVHNNWYIITVTYIKGNKPYFIQIPEDEPDTYYEVDDPVHATTFPKKAPAMRWIEENGGVRSKFMKAEDRQLYLMNRHKKK